MMLKEALTKWISTSVTGEVEIELRRGDDYTLIATRAEHMAYAPEKLSMERVEEPAFNPEDRIGALEVQNLSIADSRATLLHHFESLRRLGAATGQGEIEKLLVEEASPKLK
jgi:argininosuccinate synthase